MIVAFGNFNEDIQRSKRIEKFLLDSNLVNAATEKHQGDLPRTHDRGISCLDMIAVSRTMDQNAIKRCGYLPFYEGVATDHRAVFIDIDSDYLFTNATQDTNKNIMRGFMTDQPKKADKYLQQLEEELEKARIFWKLEELEKEMKAYNNRRG